MHIYVKICYVIMEIVEIVEEIVEQEGQECTDEHQDDLGVIRVGCIKPNHGVDNICKKGAWYLPVHGRNNKTILYLIR